MKKKHDDDQDSRVDHSQYAAPLATASENALVPTLNDRQFRLLAHCTMRYALGRRTYIVGEVCGTLRMLAPRLDRLTRSLMLRDIANERDLGDPCDVAEWRELQHTLEALESASADPAVVTQGADHHEPTTRVGGSSSSFSSDRTP